MLTEESSGSPASTCLNEIQALFEVVEARKISDDLLVTAIPRRPLTPKEVEDFARKLASQGCYAVAHREGALYRIYVKRNVSSPSRAGLALALGAIVVASLYLSGLALASSASELGLNVSKLAWSPWSYVIGLLVPLLIHEAGHYVAMRLYGVPSSVPIPLPGPPLQLGFLGTFGSVILMRWPPPTSDSLAVIGIAGPLAGFIAAVPVAILGIQDSPVLPSSELPPGTTPISITPLVMVLLTYIKNVPEGYYILLSPLAFASYVMFFVTFLNLIPIGQLDGGHVVRALLGEGGHQAASKLFIGVLLVASLVVPTFLLFALIAIGLYMLTGGRHPGPTLLDGKHGRRGVIAGITYGVLLVLTFPIPLG